MPEDETYHLAHHFCCMGSIPQERRTHLEIINFSVTPASTTRAWDNQDDFFFFFLKLLHITTTGACKSAIHTHTYTHTRIQNWFSLHTNNNVKDNVPHITHSNLNLGLHLYLWVVYSLSNNCKNKRMKFYCHWPHWSKISSEASISWHSISMKSQFQK